MEEINQFKKENGNVTYSVKELLGGIHVKLDKISEQMKEGSKKFAVIETKQEISKRLFIAVFSAMAGLLILMLKLTGNI